MTPQSHSFPLLHHGSSIKLVWVELLDAEQLYSGVNIMEVSGYKSKQMEAVSETHKGKPFLL